MRQQLVLASTSSYRRALLERLGVPFTVCAPQVEENRHPGEAPQDMARRLAREKALAVAKHFPNAILIGSDQVAVVEGEIFGKPGNHAAAARQLRSLSGREAVFHTGLCVHNAATVVTQTRVIPFYVAFRKLSDETIERYLLREQPYDCAGSAKSEGLGIALIAKMTGDDPHALIGLPLIALVDMLHEQGFDVV